MKTKKPIPPKSAERFLSRFCKGALLEEILGDLYEYHDELIGLPDWKRKLYYWFHVLHFLRPFALKESRSVPFNHIAIFRYNFKLAVRNALKSKTYSVINMVGLSLSISVAFLIYFSVFHEYSYYDTISTRDRVYQIAQRSPGDEQGNYTSSYLLSSQLAETFPEIESFTRFVGGGSNTFFTFTDSFGKDKYLGKNRFCIADQSFFDVFPFDFVHGSRELALNNLNNVVISEEIAATYFEGVNPIGKILHHSDGKDLMIAGVVRLPKNINEYFDVLARIDLFSPGKLKKWDRDGPSYVLINEKSNIEILRQKLANYEIHNPNTKDAASEKIQLVPIDRVNVYWGWGDVLMILVYVASFILIIASLNYANLSSALKLKRQKEFRLKKIMGAGKAHFFYQVFADSALIVLCSFLLSLVIIHLLSPFFSGLLQIKLDPFGDDLVFSLVAALGLLLICVLISDLLAQALGGIKRGLIVTGQQQKGKSGLIWNKINISFQFSISLFLIIGSIVIIKQRDYIYNKDLGVTYQNILHYTNNSMITEKFKTIKSIFYQNSGVKSITLMSALPTDVRNDYFVYRESENEKLKVNFKFLHVWGNFAETFDLQFVHGGPFEESDIQNKGFIINETGMKALNFTGNPVGEIIEFWGKSAPIVGVVKDFHNVSLFQEIRPLVITNNQEYDEWMKQLYVKIGNDDILNTIDFVDGQLMELLPGYPLVHTLLDEKAGKRYNQLEAFNKIFISAAFVALFTAGVGLLGMVLFFVERRTKEIAIRKVSGATVYQVVWLVLFSFSKWIAVGFPVVGLISWMATKEWLQAFAYRTTLDWWIFALSGIIVLSIGWITASYHTVKAALVNPAHTLRNE